jgi:hypothetical protein
MSWLRLQEDYPKRLRSLRWEATAVWPIVAVLLKRGRGVVEEEALDPIALKLEWNGIPERIIERGLQALKDGDILSQGTKVLKRGRGSRQVRGWIAELDIKPDPRPMASRRQTLIPGIKTVDSFSSQGLKTESVENPPKGTKTGGVLNPSAFNPRDKSLNPRDKNVGLGQEVGITARFNPPSRGRARIPSFLLLERDKKEEKGEVSLWDVYRQSNPSAHSQPPRLWISITSKLLKEFSEEDIACVLRWAAISPDYDWHRRRRMTAFNTVLAPAKFAGRLERARAWALRGAAAGAPIETVGEFHKLADEDKEDLCSWPQAKQQDWVSLVESGWPGAAAMLEVESPL